jgi:exoribonuclease-2
LSTSGTGDSQSWQASALSGKHLKLKAKEVWLQFDHANPQEVLEEAHGIAATIDLQLLWDCAPDQEFSFQAIAKEYFGDTVGAPQLIGLAIALQGAPVYFRRKGRGVFMRAPLEQLQAGLAAIERKQRELLQQEAWQAELIEGRLPDALHSQVNSLLFRPDKNSLAYKAFHGACEQTGEHPARLLMRCAALDSPQSYHHGQFVQAHFPKGTGFASDFRFTGAEFEKAVAGLPTAQVKAFSIDDAGTTEIDDALSLTPIGDGLYRLGIHIAAPGLLIQKGDRFDQVARERMSTVYFPGDKITMLPEQFVEYFSLDAGSARPAVSLYVEIDALGQRTQTPPQSALELVPIETNLRLDDWEPLVDEAFLAQENSSLPHHEALNRLWVLAQNEHQKRQEQRVKDGLRVEVLGQADPNALIRDFNFKITSSSNEIVIEPRTRGSILDTIVAECMILCNRVWGQALAEHGLPALFRTQKGWGAMRTRMQTTPGPHEGLGVMRGALRHYVGMRIL